MKDIAGRVAVVTGAGSGIGRATALALARAGAEVVCADIDLAAAERTAGAARGHAYEVDVADAGAMEKFAAEVRDRHGVPGVVVNNAGIAVIGDFMDTTAGDWERILGVNLWGVIHGCRLFAAQLKETGERGHIVNIASAAAFGPTRSLAAYCTTKSAVKMLSDCLRAELAGSGIGVTAICPGFVNTPIAANAGYPGLDEAAAAKLRRRGERGLRLRHYPPEKVAAQIMRAIQHDRAVVPVNAEGHLIYAMSRISPSALRLLARLKLQ